MFRELPHEYVSPTDLKDIVENGGTYIYMNVHNAICSTDITADSRKVYATVVDKADHLYRLQGGEYDDAEFESHPDRYGSIFADQVHVYTYRYMDIIYTYIASFPGSSLVYICMRGVSI